MPMTRDKSERILICFSGKNDKVDGRPHNLRKEENCGQRPIIEHTREDERNRNAFNE
jgi:hypothetical protein